ncbi:hypothetical protein [Blastopirellula marina]|uniref:Glycosyl transferase n=1 Tax=Blastopirellula marina TaxID=124 RepID=A0A2S8GPP7_9BACT|nr:hypothetical protein [Blastopirellula marina]PQO45974.1 hypothetical protein C5Y93_12035 [Blastopirellula marina]
MNSRSIAYAQICLNSLLQNSLDPLHLVVIGDDDNDAQKVQSFCDTLVPLVPSQHKIDVIGKSAIDKIATSALDRYPLTRMFREGHPCWRKLTDPLLLAQSDELIVIDPDVFFPNIFQFPKTPNNGVLLMWQSSNCLHPPDAVRTAFTVGLALADHTDIGVCQFQRGSVTLQLLESILGSFGDFDFPRSAHIESIIWAAIALEIGGGYLAPNRWICWNHSLYKRIAIRLGANPSSYLQGLNLSEAYCLHLGGKIKTFAPNAFSDYKFGEQPLDAYDSATAPFQPYSISKFERKMRTRQLIRAAGFYAVFGEN